MLACAHAAPQSSLRFLTHSNNYMQISHRFQSFWHIAGENEEVHIRIIHRSTSNKWSEQNEEGDKWTDKVFFSLKSSLNFLEPLNNYFLHGSHLWLWALPLGAFLLKSAHEVVAVIFSIKAQRDQIFDFSKSLKNLTAHKYCCRGEYFHCCAFHKI